MIIRATTLALMAALFVSPPFAGPSLAGPSSQHSTQSIDQSGQAASHGSAAISTGAATVIAVPILTVGISVAISGAALATVPKGSIAHGNDLATIPPNAAPTLD